MNKDNFKFHFDIISNTHYYKDHFNRCKQKDYVRDVCNNKLTRTKSRDEYINVVQKSSLWLKLRVASHGTASSLGKYIPGSKWSTPDTLNQEWNEKLQKKPFEKTQTMEAHMSWGNEYEDLALLCFAEQYKLCVTQVGTIRVDFEDIHDNYTLYFPELPELVSNEIGIQENYHLLISPDGIVGKRDKKNINYTKMSKNLTGMLEIKCMSPFHHEENFRGNLVWAENMENRQWYNTEDIPYVYLIQMCLQALSGVIELNMNFNDTMYFERWSPKGFSVFKLPFYNIFKIGTLANELYFSILHRSKKENFVAYPLTSNEELVSQKIQDEITVLFSKIIHNYHSIETVHLYYNIFQNYYQETQHKEFNMNPKHQEENKCLI
tara:strand:- start:543 stop:1676 length:1134 start_codon:yes stop_codon:yes gene_type:complete